MKLSVVAAATALALSSLTPAPADAAPKTRNVAIVIYEGAEVLDFAGPSEVMSAAGHLAGFGTNVYTVSRSTEPVMVQGFIKVVPQYSIDNAPKPDVVVIPGGSSNALSSDPKMMTWLKSTTAASEVTLTVCTGAFPLAEVGIFDGMTITTFHGAIEGLQAKAPKAHVEHGRRFVDNGKYVTTAGVSAGIDGALHVVARLWGRRVADQTAQYMEYHWTPESYLAGRYAYWNPSTDERGRTLQQAKAAIDEKRPNDAIPQLRTLLQHDADGEAAVLLGNTLMDTHDRKGAIAAYKRVVPSQKSYARATYNLACAYALDGDRTAAKATLTKAFGAGIKRDLASSDPDLVSIKDDIATL